MADRPASQKMECREVTHFENASCRGRDHRQKQGSWGERSAGGQQTGLTAAADLRLLLRKTQFPSKVTVFENGST